MDAFSEELILKSKNLSKSVLQIIYDVTKSPYKIPRACLLNRLPVYGTPNTSEVTSTFVDNQKFVLTIRNLC